jgi:hypothetical protein
VRSSCWRPTARSIASTAQGQEGLAVILVIVSLGVMFVMNGMVRFIIGAG